MARAASGRALRIGVLLRDHLVEERTVIGVAPVTFGQSLRCTLSLPFEGLPAEHVLFSHAGTWVLHAPGEVDAPLATNARGKLVIGEVTVLYQEMAAPPVMPKLKLPLSIRGTFADRIDKRLAVIIGSSLVVHIAIAAWAWATDVDIATLGTPPIAQSFHQDTMDVTLPDDPKLPTAEQGAAVPVSPGQTATPMVPRTRVVDRAPAAPSLAPDDAFRLATALTTEETAERGTVGMANRTPGTDIQDQMTEIRDRHLTVGTDTGFRRDPTPHPGTTTGPVIGDNRIAQTSPHRDEGIPRDRFRLIPEPPSGTGVTPTVDQVVGRISAVYMVGLQRCYQHALGAGAPSLGGKVAISFTVNETGRVVEAEARGMSEVDTCIHAQMLTWRFPAPKDAHGTSTDASFGVTLVLRSE